MSGDDRFDRAFGRFLRVLMTLLGSSGFVFEVLSPDRTLWVGLLSVGLLGGQVAGLVEILARGITIGAASKSEPELGSRKAVEPPTRPEPDSKLPS